MKLIFLPDNGIGIKPKDFANRFLSTAKQADFEISKSFFKKLYIMDIVSDEEIKDGQN